MGERPFDLTGSDEAWRNIVPGSSTSQAQSISTDRGTQPYRLAKWRGEPGVYDRPNGMPWSEIFVIYKGSGKITIDDKLVSLHPGSVIELVKGKAYVMEITETIEKMAVINEA